MSPVVAVEVSPAPPNDARDLAALLSACSLALPVGACKLQGAVEQTQPAAAQAHVTWDEKGNALVLVQLESSDHQLTRELVFSVRDPQLQRWRTAGLTIATMVDELRIEREAGTNEPTPPAAPGPAPKPPSASPALAAASPAKPAPSSAKPPRPPLMVSRNPSSNAIETGALLGVGIDGETARGGLFAGGLHDVAGMPALALVRVAFQVSSTDEPSLSWLELGLGGGAYFSVGALRLETAGALEMVRTTASARSPTSGAVDEAAAWLPAAMLFARGVWPAHGSVSGSLGLSGQWTARQVAVTNAGQEVARAAAYSVGLVGGIRFLL